MISTATALPQPQHKPFTRLQSVGLVFCCTIFGAAAQILIKTGVNHVGLHLDPFHTSTYFPFVLSLVTNVPLVGGYALYGLNTLLLVLALRDGELSALYPVIALTYVWVTMLSFLIFHEMISGPKAAGIALIVLGVTLLGRSAAR